MLTITPCASRVQKPRLAAAFLTELKPFAIEPEPHGTTGTRTEIQRAIVTPRPPGAVRFLARRPPRKHPPGFAAGVRRGVRVGTLRPIVSHVGWVRAARFT